MKIVRSITIASALLATVAFSSPMAFAADSAQVEQDKLMCQHIAQQAVLLMPPFEQQEAFLNTYYQCMNGKGYGPGVAEKQAMVQQTPEQALSAGQNQGEFLLLLDQQN